MNFLLNNALVLPGALYNRIDITQATTALRVANVAGALVILNSLLDLRDNALATNSHIGNELANGMLKTVTDKDIFFLRVLLINSLAQIRLNENLLAIDTIINGWAIRMPAKSIFHGTQFGQ